MRIEMGPPVELAPRDTLLLASDGLFDNLFADEIVEAIRSGPLDNSIGSLVEAAQGRMATSGGTTPSKPDDLTVIAFRLA
jgi:serine/threonine protein phosphatase PrpC